MNELEKAEKIREKTGVSYEEAKEALEANNYDVLDAIVYLEKAGKVKAPSMSSYSTSSVNVQASQDFAKAQNDYRNSCKRSTFGENLDRLFAAIKKLLKKSWDTTFVINKQEKEFVSMPVLILIVLILCAFWITIPLLIVGLFFDFRYHFVGVDKINVDVNGFCDKAAEVSNEIKDSFTSDKRQ